MKTYAGNVTGANAAMNLLMSLKFIPFLPTLLFENNFFPPAIGTFGFAHALSQPFKNQKSQFLAQTRPLSDKRNIFLIICLIFRLN